MNAALVYKNELVPNLFDFVIQAPEIAQKAVPGQFVHVLCGGDTYLRRPISICETMDGEFVRFIFEVRGEGTKMLAQKQKGDIIDVLGPLGRGFKTDLADSGTILLIGGGIGVFPLLQLAKSMEGKTTALLGFRSESSVVLANDFVKHCKNLFIATDDGSCGYHGFVTDILKNIAENNKISAMYTCGPKMMMKIVADVAKQYDIPAQVSMEERMGCGVGACVTCTCNVAGTRARVCKDGPIFYAKDVEWE